MSENKYSPNVNINININKNKYFSYKKNKEAYIHEFLKKKKKRNIYKFILFSQIFSKYTVEIRLLCMEVSKEPMKISGF